MANVKAKCSCNSKPFFPAKVKAKVGDFERVITFRPGFVCENIGKSYGHGRHGMELLFLLKGEKGAMQFLLYTGWGPDWEEFSQPNGISHLFPMPADLGYHSPKPMYEGQEPVLDGEDCPWLGVPCYYDGSGLAANAAFKVLVQGGEEALWDFLEEAYKSRFDEMDF